jgi:type IX secretion system PorP/SprF family membrane protein
MFPAPSTAAICSSLRRTGGAMLGWRKLALSLLGLCLMGVATAPQVLGQDIHFSQFQANPQSVDPSLAGTFDGTFRAVAQYRNQWQFAGRFHTLGFAMDAPFGRSKNGDFFGGGLQVFADQAGELAYRSIQVQAALAYHKSLGGDNNHYLAVGFQFGGVQRSIDFSQVNAFDPEPVSLLSNNQVQHLDYTAGLSWFKAFAPNRFVYAGWSMAHLNRPDISFREDAGSVLSIRHNGYVGASLPMGRSWFVQPAAVQMLQGIHRQWNLGMNLKWWLNPDQSLFQQEKALYAGLWYRWDDAVIASMRMDLQAISIGLSYDVNISTLSGASNGAGGPEVSLMYRLDQGNGPGAQRQRNYRQLVCPNFF